MARSRPSQLIQQYATEAFEAYVAERKRLREKYPSDPTDSSDLSGHLPQPNLIFSRIGEEQSDLGQSRNEIVERLQKIRYPYPTSNDPGGRKTLYQHLSDRGILDLLLEPPLLFNIRMIWAFQRSYGMETQLFKAKKSQYEIPLKLHRQMLTELVRHVRQLDKFANNPEVPRDWFSGYRTQILSAILREAAVCYPKMPESSKAAAQIRPLAGKISDQMMLFEEITRALATRNIKSDKLTYHLVACLYSPLGVVRTGKLEPLPASVSKTIRDARKK